MLFIDAANVFFGNYGVNPGWKLNLSPVSPLSESPSHLNGAEVRQPSNRRHHIETPHSRASLPQTLNWVSAMSFGSSPTTTAVRPIRDPDPHHSSFTTVGATYIVGGGTMNLNTGGQVYMGQQNPAPGSLEEIESHVSTLAACPRPSH